MLHAFRYYKSENTFDDKNSFILVVFPIRLLLKRQELINKY